MIREKRQSEAVQAYLDSEGKSLIAACPRFGKCRVGIKILEKLESRKVLLAAPRTEIHDSWKKEFLELGYKNDQIIFTTFKSFHKYENEIFDFVICDEPQEFSSKNFQSLKNICKNNDRVLCLSGTVTKKTLNNLFYNGGITTCYEYSIAQGVKEKILADYTVHIHKVGLDNEVPKYLNKKGKMVTEKVRFGNYSYVIDELKDKGESTFFMELKLINILQNSEAKINKAKELLEKFKDQRCLVFCGLTEKADELGIPVYHSKSKEKQLFEDFCEGRGNHMACVKLIQSGVTVRPISHGIMNYLSGAPEDSAQKICRFLGFEYDNPEKKAEIHIICTTEPFEEERLTTALSFFDPKKIKIYETLDN